MALKGILSQAHAEFFTAPHLIGGGTMQAIVDVQDDVIGSLGARTILVNDPVVVAQVMAFVAQMLPSLSAQLGIPVELPSAPVPPEDVP